MKRFIFNVLLGICIIVPGLYLLVGPMLRSFKPKSGYTLLFNLLFASGYENKKQALKAVADNLPVIKPMVPFLGRILLREWAQFSNMALFTEFARDEIFLNTLLDAGDKEFKILLSQYLNIKLPELISQTTQIKQYLNELHDALKDRGLSEASLEYILWLRNTSASVVMYKDNELLPDTDEIDAVK